MDIKHLQALKEEGGRIAEAEAIGKPTSVPAQLSFLTRVSMATMDGLMTLAETMGEDRVNALAVKEVATNMEVLKVRTDKIENPTLLTMQQRISDIEKDRELKAQVRDAQQALIEKMQAQREKEDERKEERFKWILGCAVTVFVSFVLFVAWFFNVYGTPSQHGFDRATEIENTRITTSGSTK